MSDFNNLKLKEKPEINDSETSRFSQGGLHIKEDDQDWGSSGMNDVQNQSEINQ